MLDLNKQQLTFSRVLGYHTIVCRSTIGDGDLTNSQAYMDLENSQLTAAYLTSFIPGVVVIIWCDSMKQTCNLRGRNCRENSLFIVYNLTLTCIAPTRWVLLILTRSLVFPPAMDSSRNFDFQKLSHQSHWLSFEDFFPNSRVITIFQCVLKFQAKDVITRSLRFEQYQDS